MEPDEKRARELAREMRQWVGATAVQGAVIFIGMGAPITSQFTTYRESDLRRACDLGLLHARRLNIGGRDGTDTIDIFAANEHPKD